MELRWNLCKDLNMFWGLQDATAMLPKDKAVTHEDADRVVAAEVRNNPGMTTTPGGVGAAMAAAAKRNQNSTI